MSSMTFRTDETMRMRFDRLVKELGLNRSRVLREALDSKIGELEQLARHKRRLRTRTERPDPQAAVRAKLQALPDVAQAIVFGSRAIGDAEERSDLDLAISCPGIDHRRWQEIAETIEEAETLIGLDLVWLEEASQTLQNEIRRTGKVVYERT